jgi:hypothetical protein
MKTLTITPYHTDRDARFGHINDETKNAAAKGNPVISIDAKKKEKIGKTYQQRETPIEVLVNYFPIKELRKTKPFGVYDIFNNQGFINVCLNADTPTPNVPERYLKRTLEI